MTTQVNLSHRLFGVSFAAYVEWCQTRRVAPKGRVLVAMVALRFRLDRNRGRCVNTVHLLSVPLASYKNTDVRTFVDKVRLILCNLDTSELDKQLMFQWLYEKFRRWSAIASKLERIRDSREGSSKRTWAYLWGAINSHLDQLPRRRQLRQPCSQPARPAHPRSSREGKDQGRSGRQ